MIDPVCMDILTEMVAESGSSRDLLTDFLARYPLLEADVRRAHTLLTRDEVRDDHAALATLGFRVVRKLGSGGQGTTYEAEATDVDVAPEPAHATHVTGVDEDVPGRRERRPRRVVIKVAHDAGTPGGMPRWIHREMVLVRRIEDHHTLQVSQVGHLPDGRAYVVRPFVNGQSLAERIRLRGDRPLDSTQTRKDMRAFARLLRFLQAAHDADILHGDLSPANVLCTDTNDMLLIDFGMAREHVDAVAPGQTINGTPGYRAPECVAGGAISARSEIWSLGTVLSEYVGGRCRGVQSAQRAITDRGLRAILECATAVEPRARYENCAAMAADIDAWLDHRPTKAGHVHLPGRIALSIRRNPVRYFYAASTVALSLLAWQQHRFAAAAAHDRDTILGLSDSHEARLLMQTECDLYPPTMANVPAMNEWLARADTMIRRVPVHNALLQRPVDDPSAPHDRSAAWQVAARRDVLDAIEALRVVTERVTRVRDLSLELHQRLQSDAAAWEEAIASIADRDRMPKYDGLRIKPQFGVVPLGVNAHSGLFEFWIPATGSVPMWSTEKREHVPTEGGAVVMVLIPPQKLTLGAQDRDPDAPGYCPGPLDHDEGPPVTTSVSAFLIAKWEVTKEQWRRWTGRDPSAQPIGTHNYLGRVGSLHPVETVTFGEAVDGLRAVGLSLPTEAQWECVARADSHGLARDTANFVPPNQDVGSLRQVGAGHANDYGVHDMLGNVHEWCLDPHDHYDPERASGDTPAVAERARNRVRRGGSFLLKAGLWRVTRRASAAPTAANPDLGVRPVRKLE